MSPWNLTHFRVGDRVVTLLYRGDQVFEPHYETWIVKAVTRRMHLTHIHLTKLLANGERAGKGWSISSSRAETSVIEEVYRNGKKYTKETAHLLRVLP